jgi:hypothetical protein
LEEDPPEKHGFLIAAQAEYDGLIKKATWTTEDKDLITARPLPLKWVFVYKFDQDGFLEKHKVRIVVVVICVVRNICSSESLLYSPHVDNPSFVTGYPVRICQNKISLIISRISESISNISYNRSSIP